MTHVPIQCVLANTRTRVARFRGLQQCDWPKPNFNLSLRSHFDGYNQTYINTKVFQIGKVRAHTEKGGDQREREQEMI